MEKGQKSVLRDLKMSGLVMLRRGFRNSGQCTDGHEHEQAHQHAVYVLSIEVFEVLKTLCVLRII